MSERKNTCSFGMIVGQVLARQRKALAIPQARIAAALGMQQSVVSRMEDGVLSIRIERLVQWAGLLNTTASKVVARAETGITVLAKHEIWLVHPPAEPTIKSDTIDGLLALHEF